MTHRPRYPKPDANQAQIFSQASDAGMTVVNTSSLTGIALDGFINAYHHGRGHTVWVQVEIKMPGEKYTDAEWTYIMAHPDLDIIRVECIEDVLRWFGWI